MRVLVIGLVVALTGWLGFDRIERALIYPFDPTYVTPGQAGLRGVREQRFETGGVTVMIWTAAPRPGKPVIFYLHGNAGGLKDRAGRFKHFQAQGYGIIAPAYRGSSGSTGQPSEPAISGDVHAIWRKFTNTKTPVVLYGESLGTGVAIGLLARLASDPTKGSVPADAVILEAPFTSLVDVARHAYPQIDPLLDHMTNYWNSLERAASITAPLLVLHGTQDTLIPVEQGRAIFDAARSPTKRFLAVKGAGHTDIWRTDVLPQIWQFIGRATR